MVKALKTTAAQMVEIARGRISEIETKDAISMVADPDVVFIYIRDIRERKRSGYIPNNVHCPRGMIEFWVDPESPYFKEIFSEDKQFVFHCASGWRSSLTVATLTDMGFEASHLKDGFTSWVEAEAHLESVELDDLSGTVLDEGKYFVIWKQENGNWLWHHDIWSSKNEAA